MMRKTHTSDSFQHWLICDRCGRKMEHHNTDCEWQEAVTLHFRADERSIFEDGQWYELDLCQHCLKETLGRHLRITPDHPFEQKRQPSTVPRRTYQQWDIHQRLESEWLLEHFLGAPEHREAQRRAERQAKHPQAAPGG